MQPTIMADRDWLHLEARYNYEAFGHGSAWLGYNFSGGRKIGWEFTPMFGGVFGDTSGIAPGYKGSLSWWKFELYSRGRIRFRHRRFVSELFLQLVGADASRRWIGFASAWPFSGRSSTSRTSTCSAAF